METTAVKSPVMLYTEQTPNPETLKFVTNRMLYKGTADFKDAESATEWSPLADSLFEFPYVKGVYICNNFVTVTKEFNYAWEDITLRLKEYLKQYISDEKTLILEGYDEAIKAADAANMANSSFSGEESELVVKIKELIDTYVKPAVEMDGGNIEFKSFDQGVVSVVLQGSCSGCPSSTVTLKSGIEGMLKRMVPEVTEVVAEMG
jgi:NFU1 iron-sulfur cluster scaffold homolog, mitochondrial